MLRKCGKCSVSRALLQQLRVDLLRIHVCFARFALSKINNFAHIRALFSVETLFFLHSCGCSNEEKEETTEFAKVELDLAQSKRSSEGRQKKKF